MRDNHLLLSDPKAQHDEMVGLAETRMKPHDRELVERQISATDKTIDSLVYELYGLTEEEIRIIEGGKK